MFQKYIIKMARTKNKGMFYDRGNKGKEEINDN